MTPWHWHPPSGTGRSHMGSVSPCHRLNSSAVWRKHARGAGAQQSNYHRRGPALACLPSTHGPEHCAVSQDDAGVAGALPRGRRRRGPAFARPAAARTRNYSKRTLVQGGVRTVYLEEHVPRHYCAALARVLRVQHVRAPPRWAPARVH